MTLALAATDSALRIAMDRESVRQIDQDGRLRVALSNISKANVCPYRGEEIPGYEEFGLEPEKIYMMLRHPDELRKAAPTFNTIQVLRKHNPVNAEDHRPYDVVGSTGSDAAFDGTYLTNSLSIWSKEAIDDIESGDKRELSCGYHYKPVMTPGVFDGKHFDGLMTDIVGNHVALVEDGRAGPDVIVGDSLENLKMKPTRLAAHALNLTAVAVAPRIAQDAKLTLPKDLFAFTSKTFKASKQKLLDGVRLSLDGKLRKGVTMDEAMSPVAKVLDALEELTGGEAGVDESVSEEQHNAMEAAAAGNSNLGIPQAVGEEFADKDKGKTFDAEPLMSFLKGKGMGDDDCKAVMDMLPKNGLAGDEDGAEDEDETDEEKAAREKKEAEEKAAKDAAMTKDMVSRGAMDEALKAHGDVVAKRIREEQQGIRSALAEIKPYVGELRADMAFDSGADVYRHALGMLGVKDAKALHADALRPVLHAQKKASELTRKDDTRIAEDMALDADVISKAQKFAPGLEFIKTVS